MNDKAKQHIIPAFIVILLIVCVFSSIYIATLDQTDEIPTDGSVDTEINPTLSIDVNTSQSLMNISWYEFDDYDDSIATVGEIGVSTTGESLSLNFQRSSFYFNGSYWQFFVNGTHLVYVSSTDGVTWTGETIVRVDDDNAMTFSIAFNGSHVHYAVGLMDYNTPIYYRMGVPGSGGTISWIAAEQTAVSAVANVRYIGATIAVDSGGNPWIGYRWSNTTTHQYPNITRSSTNDGTWTTNASFPYQLNSTSGYVYVNPVAMDNQEMFVYYVYNGNQAKGRHWTGSWGAEENATSEDVKICDTHSTLYYNETVFLAYMKETTNDLKLVTRTATGWNTAETIVLTPSTGSFPQLTLNEYTETLFCMWEGGSGASPNNTLWYSKRHINSSWDASPTHWFDYNVISGIDLTTPMISYNGNVTLTWTNAGNNSLGFKRIQTDWTLIGTNSLVPNGTYTQTTNNFSSYDTVYHWRVIVNDGVDNVTEVYHFTTGHEVTGIHSMPRINPSGITNVGNTTANATMTITNGYNCSYGVWYGTTFPVTESNADGNVSSTGSEWNQSSGTLAASITGLTPSQLYHTTAWVSNPSGDYNSSYYNHSFTHYSYTINGSSWHYITFPYSIWSNNQSADDAQDADNNITIETFLNISNVLDDVDWIYRVSDNKNWNKGAGGNTLTNLTYDEKYYFNFLNATNISFVFDGGSTYWYTITFPQELFDYNASINVNDTCKNFCQQGGIYDDITFIFRDGDWTNWKAHPPNAGGTLQYIESGFTYFFEMLNYTADLNFIYDKANTNSTFLTKPNPPTNLNIDFNTTHAVLTWNKNSSANRTIITVKIASSPTSPSDGTTIYNGTGETYTDSYDDYTSRFYKAWSYTNWSYNPTLWQISSGNASANTTYTIDPPYNGQSEYDYPYLNVTWSRGNRSIQEVVVSRNDTWATTATQSGNWIRQNSTTMWFNVSDIEMRYYTIWSYNITDNIYSIVGLNIPWGSMAMSCYDEITHEALVFNILITNSDLDPYAANNLTNIHYLDMNDIPYGENTIFYISNGTHESRTYYDNIYLNNFYNLTFYLPLAMPPEGTEDPDYDPENESYSTLYLLTVVDEANNGIEGVKIRIMRYINETDTYENVTILISDANGQADVYLYDGTVYKVNLSKTGYVPRTDDWIPSDVIFTRTFRLKLEEEEYENETTYNEAVTFEGYVDSSGYVHVNYTDSLNETTSTNICIYEHNTTTGNATVFYWDNRTNENDFTFNVLGNTSNCYEAVLSLVHTTFGTVTDSFIICGDERPYINISDQTWADALFEANYGTNPFGWSNFFGFFILLAGVFSFGQKNTGVSLIVTGGILIFINTVIGWTIMATSIPVLFIILGVLVQWANHRREATG